MLDVFLDGIIILVFVHNVMLLVLLVQVPEQLNVSLVILPVSMVIPWDMSLQLQLLLVLEVHVLLVLILLLIVIILVPM